MMSTTDAAIASTGSQPASRPCPSRPCKFDEGCGPTAHTAGALREEGGYSGTMPVPKSTGGADAFSSAADATDGGISLNVAGPAAGVDPYYYQIVA